MTESAKKVTITIANVTIGGLESWELQPGQVRESTFRPLNGAPVARPGFPDYGSMVLNLYRDAADNGQELLRDSLRNRETRTFVITHGNGEIDTFQGFCVLFPIRGSKSSATPITLTRCVVRISGSIATSTA
jgi:hypothetical protein